jgi:uncharacterized protein (TIGR02421 family)
MVRRIDAHETNETGDGRWSAVTPHEATVRALSDRLVELARPVRILDAVRWDDEVEATFFSRGARELPRVTRDYYDRRPLSFEPRRQRAAFADLEREVRRRLGDDPAGRLLTRRCREGQAVADLVARRGTPEFAARSRGLYGRASDCLDTGWPALALPAGTNAPPAPTSPDEPEFSAAHAARALSQRLTGFFHGEPEVRVRLSDGIHADAAARGDCISVRHDGRFTAREVRLLEVHEGWVHLGTTLNAQAQPICTFLTRGSPSATVTQEGLAVLTEVLAQASYPARARRLAQRVEAVALAEAGADFLDVYRYYGEQGNEPRAAYQHTARVFRGSLPEKCGPFTKDLAYCKGLAQVTDFIRAAAGSGQTGHIPLLFCGKTSLADIPDLAQLADAGLLRPPRYLPPPFMEGAQLTYGLAGGGISLTRSASDSFSSRDGVTTIIGMKAPLPRSAN